MCIYGHTSEAMFPQPKWARGAGSRHFSQEQTRTCQAGRARWATLFPDTLAGILLTKASTSSLPSTEQAALSEARSSPSPGMGLEAPVEQCWAISFSLLPQGPSMQTEGLTSWRMSSSLGMMDSSRVSSLQRQREGQAEATGQRLRTGIWLKGPGWGEAGKPDTHLLWIRPMTWEYVFPMTLSRFTFTSRSPGDKGGITCESPKQGVQCTPVLNMTASKRRGPSPASGFMNSNPIKRDVSPRSVTQGHR